MLARSRAVYFVLSSFVRFEFYTSEFLSLLSLADFILYMHALNSIMQSAYWALSNLLKDRIWWPKFNTAQRRRKSLHSTHRRNSIFFSISTREIMRKKSTCSEYALNRSDAKVAPLNQSLMKILWGKNCSAEKWRLTHDVQYIPS